MSKSLTVIIIVIVLVVGAGAAFVVLSNKDKADNVSEQTSSVQETTDSTATTSAPQETTTEPTEENAPSSSVTIKNFAFSPNALTVKKGTTVTWTNQDSAEHNAFSDQDGGPKGNLLKKGESYSFTFNKVGTFNYICQPHPHMKGTVTVTD